MIFVVGVLFGCAGRRRHMRVVAVDVGAERGRDDAGGNRFTGQAIGEMAAMADINPQSTVECGLNHRMNLALAIDEAAGVTRKGMCEDIA